MKTTIIAIAAAVLTAGCATSEATVAEPRSPYAEDYYIESIEETAMVEYGLPVAVPAVREAFLNLGYSACKLDSRPDDLSLGMWIAAFDLCDGWVPDGWVPSK